jgi:cobalamin biosynthesis Mg chelatase CobN
MTDSGPAQKPTQRRSAGSRTSTRADQAVAPTPDDGRPETDAHTGPSDDVQELQQEIEQAREQLGETVEQLVAKADVKARARGKAAELAGRVKGPAAAARAQAVARAGSVRDQLASNAAGAGQKAVYFGAAARKQTAGRVAAAGAPAWEATPERARQALAKGASSARQYRVPLAVAATVLVMGLVVIRMRSKR